MDWALRANSEFQLNAARRWIELAEEVKGKPAFEFVAYFSALNALYWLWGLTAENYAFPKKERELIGKALEGAGLPEDVRKKLDERLSSLRNEPALIRGLVDRFSAEECERLVAEHSECVRYLCMRPGIRRMDRRSNDIAEGDPDEGENWIKKLKSNTASYKDKAKALAQVLYLVRSNLVHGSKIIDGLDEELLVHCIKPLRAYAKAAITYTEANRP